GIDRRHVVPARHQQLEALAGAAALERGTELESRRRVALAADFPLHVGDRRGREIAVTKRGIEEAGIAFVGIAFVRIALVRIAFIRIALVWRLFLVALIRIAFVR